MRHDEQVFFREEQSFRQPWVWACVLLPMVFIGGGLLWQILTGRPWGNHPLPTSALVAIEAVLAVIAVWVYQMRLVTEVRARGLVVHFQWLWRRRLIPFTEIASYRAVKYNPIADYGGWGIRYSMTDAGKAYNVSGDRGVQLEFMNGGRLLVGSQQPEELTSALDAATRADATPPARTHGWSAEGN
jgi:hypothetical protein